MDVKKQRSERRQDTRDGWTEPHKRDACHACLHAEEGLVISFFFFFVSGIYVCVPVTVVVVLVMVP